MQPRPERFRLPQRSRPAHQHEERGLERVLHIGRIVQDSPADTQNHRPMPGHQRLERVLIRASDKLAEDLSFRRLRDAALVEQPLNFPKEEPAVCARHIRRSVPL